MVSTKNIYINFKSQCIPTGLLFIIFVANILSIHCSAQSFSVKKTPFNSSVADDFAPVFYKKGLVYCSNSMNTSLVSIKSENEALFNLVYTELKDSGDWKTPVLLAEELTTILNEGPASFTADQNRIYYARNLQTEGKLRKINDPSNTLGIYSADLVQGKWVNISGFEFNSESYSVGTPALSPDGQRLYFASDKPGSYGGTDLYYSDRIMNKWSEPVNLGPEINSKYNESYPFIDESGRLFFASDKPGGNGGKDIYYSLELNGTWLYPIHLDREINSGKDDFGFITDKNFEKGYFSSNRKSGMNIYYFETKIPQFDICEIDSSFNFCYEFYDERFTDTLHLEYEWDFGHGNKIRGKRVRKCFTKPGAYTAVLTIIHHLADCTFHKKYDYNFEVGYDNNTVIYPEENILLNQPTDFMAVKKAEQNTYNEYYWNFGDGYNNSGKNTQHIFNKAGEHQIFLGIVCKDSNYITKSKQCLQTKVVVYSDYQELATQKYPCIPSLDQVSLTRDINKNTNYFLINNYMLADFQPKVSDSLTSLFSSFPNYFLFVDSNGNLTSHTKKLLENYAHILNKFPDIKLIIATHQNYRGRLKNIAAESGNIGEVVKEFFELYDIQNDRVECISYGNTKPLDSKYYKKNIAFNKRIEFILSNRF
jgi:outer membrane protein OmpA-like peptidoglycan-associated protein